MLNGAGTRGCKKLKSDKVDVKTCCRYAVVSNSSELYMLYFSL